MSINAHSSDTLLAVDFGSANTRALLFDVVESNAVIAGRPELLIIAGGSDGGATRALLKLVETIALACHLLPPGSKTRTLFVGNADLQARMRELLGAVSTVHVAPNVQPELS